MDITTALPSILTGLMIVLILILIVVAVLMVRVLWEVSRMLRTTRSTVSSVRHQLAQVVRPLKHAADVTAGVKAGLKATEAVRSWWQRRSTGPTVADETDRIF